MSKSAMAGLLLALTSFASANGAEVLLSRQVTKVNVRLQGPSAFKEAQRRIDSMAKQGIRLKIVKSNKGRLGGLWGRSVDLESE